MRRREGKLWFARSVRLQRSVRALLNIGSKRRISRQYQNGGHISECLSRLCDGIGLPFRVYDERPEFANRERFPKAREVLCAPYNDLGPHVRLSTASHCVVLTHGHAQDELVLEQLLQVPFLPYLGMVGSSRKLQGIRERLAVKGLTLGPHVYSPAGLALGGGLPGDIALSILAEIKLVMDGGRPEHLRKPI